MPRPQKIGLDYFPMDTDRFQDRKTRKLIKQFGPLGPATYLYLLCQVYRDKGYYLQLDDDLVFDTAYELKTEAETIENIIKFCFTIDLFDSRFEAERKLTSASIQARYERAKADKRRNGAIKPLQPQPVQDTAHQIDPKFDLWLKKFDYDSNAIEAKNEWFNLQPEEQEKALKVVDSYRESTPEKTYRKKPHNYLREKCFNNEILPTKTKQEGHPNHWDPKHAKKLVGNQITDYYKHLKSLRWTVTNAQGGQIWHKPKPIALEK